MITYDHIWHRTRGERGALDVSASSRLRAVLHRPIRLRAQAHAQRVLAALEQQRELVHRQRERPLAWTFPRRREVSDLEALAEHAQPGAVEVQRLGPLPRPPDEDEDVA